MGGGATPDLKLEAVISKKKGRAEVEANLTYIFFLLNGPDCPYFRCVSKGTKRLEEPYARRALHP